MRMRIAAAVLLAAGGLWWVQSLRAGAADAWLWLRLRVRSRGRWTSASCRQIDVGQRGDWKVSLATFADTRVSTYQSYARASALRSQGGRYLVTWPTGEREGIVVAQMAGTWVRALVDGPPRWVNLSSARAIEQEP